jgi:hypothetical protein
MIMAVLMSAEPGILVKVTDVNSDGTNEILLYQQSNALRTLRDKKFVSRRIRKEDHRTFKRQSPKPSFQSKFSESTWENTP